MHVFGVKNFGFKSVFMSQMCEIFSSVFWSFFPCNLSENEMVKNFTLKISLLPFLYMCLMRKIFWIKADFYLNFWNVFAFLVPFLSEFFSIAQYFCNLMLNKMIVRWQRTFCAGTETAWRLWRHAAYVSLHSNWYLSLGARSSPRA